MTQLRDFDLYNDGFIEEFADGDKYLERDHIIYDGDETDRFHTVKQTDTITAIANFYYKDIINNARHYWWVIADANDITNPMDLTELIGYEIIIPDPVLFQLKV